MNRNDSKRILGHERPAKIQISLCIRSFFFFFFFFFFFW